jgi:hypothetical protein
MNLFSNGQAPLLDHPAPSPISTAVISVDGRYRYELLRAWQPSRPLMVWIMLNPSTADAAADDQTIRRCEGYARRNGSGGIIVVNLYGYRATNPADLATVEDPVGPENDVYLSRWIKAAARDESPVVAGWGTHAPEHRIAVALTLAEAHGVQLKCVGTTATGAPRHPSRGSYAALSEWPAVNVTSAS